MYSSKGCVLNGNLQQFSFPTLLPVSANKSQLRTISSARPSDDVSDTTLDGLLGVLSDQEINTTVNTIVVSHSNS